DTMPEAIESFAQENNVRRGMCILIGGIGGGKTYLIGKKRG
ncbi:unnamed protein product, partial [marine sediment metagenome]